MKPGELGTQERIQTITEKRLVDDLTKLGVEPGDSLVITSSISEIGWVEGGAMSVLSALLAAVGPQGSVHGLSFTKLYKLPLSRRNSRRIFDLSTPAYTGTLNNLILRHPRSVRSLHPAISFVGIGHRAVEVLSKHSVSSLGYYPVFELAKYDNSKMLLLGTVERCPGVTTVHVAQNILGLQNNDVGRFGIRYVDRDGETKLYVCNYVGGCSRGFYKFYDHYREARAVSEGRVGNAVCMLARLKMTLSIDMEILKREPGFFFCDNRLCYSCQASWKHSPISPTRWLARKVMSKLRGSEVSS